MVTTERKFFFDASLMTAPWLHSQVKNHKWSGSGKMGVENQDWRSGIQDSNHIPRDKNLPDHGVLLTLSSCARFWEGMWSQQAEIPFLPSHALRHACLAWHRVRLALSLFQHRAAGWQSWHIPLMIPCRGCSYLHRWMFTASGSETNSFVQLHFCLLYSEVQT